MGLLKKYGKVRGSSLVESTIALGIISICLYFAIMIYANVYNPKTSIHYYNAKIKANEMFFTNQIAQDSLLQKYNSSEWEVINEIYNSNIKQVTVKHKDSTGTDFLKTFYIPN